MGGKHPPTQNCPVTSIAQNSSFSPPSTKGIQKRLLKQWRQAFQSSVPTPRALREIITHLKNGWLSGTDAASIRESIMELSASADIRAHLAKNARAFALANYSLDHIIGQELSLLESLI